MSINPLITNYGPSASLFAPASGGGGGGGGGSNFSNINVSSINFTSNPGYITYTGGIAIDGLNTGAQDFLLASPINYQPTFPAGLNSTLGCAFTMTAPDNQAYIQTTVATNEAIFIDAVGAGGGAGIYINAGGVATNSIGCSTLTVSSINGLAPGGGGGSIPADPSFSTLTLADEPTALGGTLSIKADDPNLYSIGVADSNALLTGEIKLGTIGGRNQFYTGVGEIDQFFVSTVKGVNDPITFLSGVNLSNALTGTTGSFSNLNLSSLNNGPLPSGNGAVQSVQSPASLGAVSVPCDAPGGSGIQTALITPLSISTILAHTYTITGTVFWQSGGNQTGSSALQLVMGNISRYYDQVQPVSTIIGPNNNYSLNWRFIASGSGQNTIYALAWDPLSNAASTIVNLQNVSVTDYGIIL